MYSSVRISTYLIPSCLLCTDDISCQELEELSGASWSFVKLIYELSCTVYIYTQIYFTINLKTVV